MTTRRQFMMSVPAAAAAFALADHLVLDVKPARAQQIDPLLGHFHPKGKAPSKFTLDSLKQAKATLPFADKRDFEDGTGFLLPPPVTVSFALTGPSSHFRWAQDGSLPI